MKESRAVFVTGFGDQGTDLATSRTCIIARKEIRMCARFTLLLGTFVFLSSCDGGGPSATSDTVPPTRPVPQGSVSVANEPGVHPVTSTDVKREIKEAFDAASKYSAEQRDQLDARLREQKAIVDRKMDDLQKKSSEMTEQAKADWARDKIVIEQHRAALDAKLEELKKSSGPAWEDLKQGTRKAWDDFEQATNDAAAHFSREHSTTSEKTQP